MQQFWDQGSKFKVEMWDQVGENIPRYDPDCLVMTKIHNMSIIFAAVGLKLTCGAILLS